MPFWRRSNYEREIKFRQGVEFMAANYLGVTMLKASMSPVLILGALAFSFVVGALSGIAPARQASKMNPVDALRYE